MPIFISSIYLCTETVDYQLCWLLIDFHQHSNDNLLVNIIIPISCVTDLGDARFQLPSSSDWYGLCRLIPVLNLILHIQQNIVPLSRQILWNPYRSRWPSFSGAPCTDSFKSDGFGHSQESTSYSAFIRFSVPGHSLQWNTASTAAAISEQQDTIAAHLAWEKWINPAISFSELRIQQAAIDIAISLVQRHKIISDFISQASVLQAEVLKGFLFRCISCLPLAH